MTEHYKYDGTPLIWDWESPQKLRIYSYLWRSSLDPPRGLIVLVHGVRAHSRLTWLVKRHCCLINASPYSVYDYTGLATKVLAPATWQHELGGGLSDAVTSEDEEGSSWPGEKEDIYSTTPDFDLPGVSPEDRARHVFYQGSWIQGFVEAGFAVFAIDLQGHGLSDSFDNRRCTVRDYDDFRDDVLFFIQNQVRPLYQDVPLFLVGVSMGGQVVMRVAQDGRAKTLHIHGVVAMAGMLTIAPQFRRGPFRAFLKANSRVLSRLVPSLPVGRYRSDNAPHWQRSVGDADPLLYKGSFTAKMVAISVSAIERVKANMQDVAYSGGCRHLLFLHNERDPVCYFEGSVDAFNEVADHADSPDSSLLTVTCLILNASNLSAIAPEENSGTTMDHCDKDSVSSSLLLKTIQSPDSTVASDKDCCPSPIDSSYLSAKRGNVKFIRDSTPLNIYHTLANDLDHAYVFGRLLSWVEDCLTSP
eukprot:Protomagalhaensia_sp_Gyna_25__1997@NODE_206_length_4408_cov_90_637217_g160_i0_p2_GENE_NODE_206_length_4408_cov_90_637217_g160_i0NODE_206_length_4408_cov_90_637217_g160_i0_p2_ORF_typecomplete_len473_score40_74Hydrolase_4/PF12146_8/1_2e03Hydrolase_4/PF12146_8/2_2e33Abhydrolase_6/PF12697_7/1_6e03Abhydrolase_6/PF12697_7/7_3e14Abhydrolase_1/PF00561_20/3_1e11DUF1100/PF06500_11/4e06DLH/PF01738_18/6_4e05Peptidase_S9/PF00326_21/0_00076Peptidase_S15/PF02129_18/7_9e05Chlorophyllase2/PF12740_7/0_00028Abhydr